MKIFLANRGNAALAQDPSKPLYYTNGSDFFVEIYSIEQAQRACIAYIRRNDIGFSNFVGGQVIDDEGHMIGYVNYSGRYYDSNGAFFSMKKLQYDECMKYLDIKRMSKLN